MSEVAVELRCVSKVFSSKKAGNTHAAKEIDLKIFQGEFFTILGPSGCGKTTLLRMIAGFETPSAGEIYIQGRRINHLPPYKRPVNTVFQNYALFPNMTVAENVAYGLKMRKVPVRKRQHQVTEALELVRMEGMEERKPAELSGGQQQRVALARALVNRPTVLALDEPLGALDLQLRRQMQHELTELQQRLGITFIYITHDQEEALAMSDRVAIINAGEMLQVGSPVAIYEKPVNRFAAKFIGENNLLSAQVTHCDTEKVELNLMGTSMQLPIQDQVCGDDQNVFLAIRPERIALALQSKLPAIVQEQGCFIDPTETLADIALSKCSSIGQQDRILLLTGTIKASFFVGLSTRYVVKLSSGDLITVWVQNTLTNENEKYSLNDSIVVWFYKQDIRLLME